MGESMGKSEEHPCKRTGHLDSEMGKNRESQTRKLGTHKNAYFQ